MELVSEVGTLLNRKSRNRIG